MALEFSLGCSLVNGKIVEGESDYYDEITLCCVKSKEKGKRWVIRNGRSCLNKEGEWVYEPMPSSRTNEFIESTRFDTLEAGLDFWGKYKNGLK